MWRYPSGKIDPFKGKRRNGRPSGRLNNATFEIKSWSRSILESSWYQASLKKRLKEGKAPQVENTLYYYAYGKPKETVEIQASENMSGLLTLALGGAILPGLLERQQLLPGAPPAIVDIVASAIPATPLGSTSNGKRRGRPPGSKTRRR